MWYIKHILFIKVVGLLILFSTLQPSFCQSVITIPDSSFENSNEFTDQFYTWTKCQGQPYPWVAAENFGPFYRPSSMVPSNGFYCAHLAGGEIDTLDYLDQIIGVGLGVPLVKGKKYYFYVDLSSIVIYLHNPLHNQDRGQIIVLLGKNLCVYNQIAWISPMLDSVWHRYKVEFVSDDNYQYIALEGWCITTGSTGDEWVDNLSSIYEEVEQPNLPSGNNAFYNANNKHLEVWCNAANNSNTTLVLYNLLGQIIVQQPYVANSSIANEIDMSALPQSIYIIEQKDQNGKKLWQQKVMK